MNKSLKIIISIALAASFVCCGTVFAMMLVRSQSENNNFDPAAVSCEVIEEGFDADTGVKPSIAVKNTSNIHAYIRVCLVSYWVDEEGNVLPKTSEMPEIEFKEGWIKREGEHVYYYKSPVAPNLSTEELLENPITVQGLNAEDGSIQVINVFAEAIQAKPAKAVEESWKVTIEGEKITGFKAD